MTTLEQTIHDIRKPLNSISMQAELIAMLVEAKSASNDEKIIAAAKKIVEQSKSCSNMLQDIHDAREN